MRRICFQRLKISDLGASLYLAFARSICYEPRLALRVASLGWIGLAIAATPADLPRRAAMARNQRRNAGRRSRPGRPCATISSGPSSNETLPSSIGGDAVRLWLVARAGAGWRAATYSIFVDRAIGLIALAILIVATLPVELQPDHRSAWPIRIAVGRFRRPCRRPGIPGARQMPWPWLKRWWGTHHLHACSVIANRVIFSRDRGPKIATLSVLVHVLTARLAWCVVRSIAAPVTFGQIFQLVPPVILITMLPISDRRLGRARGHHGACLRICRVDDE